MLIKLMNRLVLDLTAEGEVEDVSVRSAAVVNTPSALEEGQAVAQVRLFLGTLLTDSKQAQVDLLLVKVKPQ